jgi:tRNA/tmRNA/rRNA uracil-C5-methylase (TrmA/RlmC/RlmD family)
VAGPHTGFPALAFEQANPVLAARIREDAVSALGDVAGRVVWDLYGGVGDTARLLAAQGALVWSVDRDRSAIEWARGQEQGRGIHWVTDLVEESLHRLPVPDAVVVNPPRSGLVARVSGALEAWAARRPGGRLAYVSCDPATLARDVARIPSAAVTQVCAYDLFPQTSHVETLVVLEAR